MRTKDRIDPFLTELGQMWKTNFTDLRFGQLMLNFLGWAYAKYGDPFFYEEDKFIKYFKEYCEDRTDF